MQNNLLVFGHINMAILYFATAFAAISWIIFGKNTTFAEPEPENSGIHIIYGSVSLFLSNERRKFVQTKKNRHSVLPSYPFGYRRGIWGLFYFVWVSYDLFD